MKRMHVHIRVGNLNANIHFYSALFNAQPAVVKPDYAKWTLEDPRVNFAISTRREETGLDHLGIQVDTEEELTEMNERLTLAELPIASQEGASCCYAKSDKHWTVDPQGIAWESYRTLDSIPTFNGAEEESESPSACCAPDAPKSVPLAFPIKTQSAANCCEPAKAGTPGCC